MIRIGLVIFIRPSRGVPGAGLVDLNPNGDTLASARLAIGPLQEIESADHRVDDRERLSGHGCG